MEADYREEKKRVKLKIKSLKNTEAPTTQVWTVSWSSLCLGKPEQKAWTCTQQTESKGIQDIAIACN